MSDSQTDRRKEQLVAATEEAILTVFRRRKKKYITGSTDDIRGLARMPRGVDNTVLANMLRRGFVGHIRATYDRIDRTWTLSRR